MDVLVKVKVAVGGVKVPVGVKVGEKVEVPVGVEVGSVPVAVGVRVKVKVLFPKGDPGFVGGLFSEQAKGKTNPNRMTKETKTLFIFTSIKIFCIFRLILPDFGLFCLNDPEGLYFPGYLSGLTERKPSRSKPKVIQN